MLPRKIFSVYAYDFELSHINQNHPRSGYFFTIHYYLLLPPKIDGREK